MDCIINNEGVKMLICFILILIIIIVCLFIYNKLIKDLWISNRCRLRAVERNFLFMCTWMDRKRKEPTALIDNLKKENCQKVLIYGAGHVGEQLCSELKETDIEVVGYIDRLRKNDGLPTHIYSLKDQLPEADSIIVSVVHDYARIIETIQKETSIKILFLEELL